MTVEDFSDDGSGRRGEKNKRDGGESRLLVRIEIGWQLISDYPVCDSKEA